MAGIGTAVAGTSSPHGSVARGGVGNDVAAAPAPAPIVAAPAGNLVSRDALGAALAAARLAAVGEKHDSLAHHQVQAEMLALLADRVPKTAVGFEMISYEDQSKLDDFASGKTSEADFAVWWKSVWGYDYALYKPIFDEARGRGLPLYGLNAPASLVKAVATKGLDALSPTDRARLPAKIEESSDPRYRAFVYDSVTGHSPVGHAALKSLMLSPGFQALNGGPDVSRSDSDPDAVARMIQAMAVWNETMGEQAARRVAEGRALLLVAGQGHVLYKAGAPESAARRGAAPTLVVLPYPLDEEGLTVPDMLARLRDPAKNDIQQADYFRLIP